MKVTDRKLKNVCCVINTLFSELCRDSSVPDHIKNEIYEGQHELCEIETRKLYEELVLEKIDIIDENVKKLHATSGHGENSALYNSHEDKYSRFAILKGIKEYWVEISIVLFINL